jgi:hypothetical protein
VKRTNLTYSKSLVQDKFSEWFSGRIHDVVSDRSNGLWLSSQLQVYGGKNSMFRKNEANGTAYSWRRATIGGTWDVFLLKHKEEGGELARWKRYWGHDALQQRATPPALGLVW